jgi:2-octaprenylphenol hydroxylase
VVGAAAAALLAGESLLQGLRIALVEMRPPSGPPEGDVDLRVSAISRASERVLQKAGAWPDAASLAAAAYEEMVVWDAASRRDGPSTLRFSAATIGQPNLGHIVENRRMQWALYGSPAMRERVSLLRAEVSALDFVEGAPRITLSDGRSIRAGLVIAADGSNSRTRELAGLTVAQKAYPQSAFVTHIRTREPHRATAYQRFLPQGPIAFLPLADGRSSIVWTTTPEQALQLVEMPLADCAAAIRDASDAVLGDVAVSAPRAHFPLQWLHADAYCRPGVVLAGDAAHTVHPLAGQGVNIGLLDVAALVEVLNDAVREQGTGAIGDLRTLRRYERWRKSENALALGMIDGLNRLFSNATPGLGLIRRAGFALVNGAPFAKRVFIERALGIGGHVPQWLRRVG